MQLKNVVGNFKEVGSSTYYRSNLLFPQIYSKIKFIVMTKIGAKLRRVTTLNILAKTYYLGFKKTHQSKYFNFKVR